MSGQVNTGGRQGMISFQSNDKLDIFQVLEVYESGVSLSEEGLIGIEDPQFESDCAWVTGYVPKLVPVNVDGDTSVIHAWFRADSFDRIFSLRIYVEFEEAEAVLNSECPCEDEQDKPKEIFL